MRVALVTNALDWPTRGNHTTVRRWLRHVDGVDVEAIGSDPERVLDPVPDVVHGYHALNGGIAARELARRHDRPLVISIGGTDLMAMLDGAPEVEPILRAAKCVTGAFASFRDLLWDGVDYVTVRRGVELPEDVRPHVPDGTLRVLLPAGLRPVKDPLLAIELAASLAGRGLALELRILGPTLDDEYARRVRERAAELPFVRLGEVEPGEMHAAYARADVVWNTSRFEGGSNALLEAMAHGVACFARDAPGNRDLLPAESLFEPGDVDRAERFHRALMAESIDERVSRMKRNRRMLRARHDPRDEARALVEVWRRVTP